MFSSITAGIAVLKCLFQHTMNCVYKFMCLHVYFVILTVGQFATNLFLSIPLLLLRTAACAIL